MDERRPNRSVRSLRSAHWDAAAFLYGILETADRLKTARDFSGEPALRFDRRWTLLRAVERCGGCPTFSDVARLLRVTRQSARVLILAAEKAGVVELFPDSHDRRALQVALTSAGRGLLEAHRLPAVTWLFTLLNGLEPERMRATVHVLAVIRQRLERYDAEMKRARARRPRA